VIAVMVRLSFLSPDVLLHDHHNSLVGHYQVRQSHPEVLMARLLPFCSKVS